MDRISNNIKKKGAVLEFGEYYLSYSKELIYLFEHYKSKHLKVAIWGSGLKGTAFLNTIDKKGQYISVVIDMNSNIQGKSITFYHKVSSLDEGLKSELDVIFIMNSNHYADNYALLQLKNFHGQILDMDYLVENKVDPNDIVSGKVIDRRSNTNDLTKVHEKLLEILLEIDRICKKHNIQYFLSAGTALGAIRHNGFIPWDDDADIGMLREDFDVFREIVKKELNPEFYYQSMNKGSDYYRAFDQIGKKNTSFVLEYTKDLNMWHGIHVDIFPFDYVSEDGNEREKHVKEVQLYRNKLFSKLVPHLTTRRNIIKKFFINYEYYKMKFVSYKYLRKKMEDSLKQQLNGDKHYVADLLTHYKKIMYFRKSDILPVKYIDFESIKLPVPSNYDKYLTMMYGDYMTPPPEGKRNQRHRIIEISADVGYEKDQHI